MEFWNYDLHVRKYYVKNEWHGRFKVREYYHLQMPEQTQQVQQQPQIGTSLESLFLFHHLDALTRLENIITMPLSLEERSALITLQVHYLLHLIPNDQKQQDILKRSIEAEEHLKTIREMEDQERHISAQFVIVTEVIKYLNSSMDIVHEDILGAAGDNVLAAIEKMEHGPSGQATAPAVSRGGEDNGSGIPAVS